MEQKMNNLAKQNNLIEESEIDFDLESMEKSLSKQLENSFSDLSLLEEERKKIGNPDSMGKTVLDEVWKQFGNQIGLDMTNETLIQQYDREHPETYDEVGISVMQDPKYKKANNKMKQQQEAGELTDVYVGKKIGRDEKANLDHTYSRKELYENQRRRQAGIETKDLANMDENLNATNENLNKSKGDKSVDKYLKNQEQRKKDLLEQNKRANEKVDNDPSLSEAEKRSKKEKNNKALQNKLAADAKRMKDADVKARGAINKEIIKGVVKQTANKAGKDALKAMAVSALFSMLKEIMNGFVRWLKSAAKTFENLLAEMKKAMLSFFSKIKDIFKVGASTAVGTIVSEVFGPIVSTFKKMASFIKQGVSSFIEAIKYLTDKSNKDKPFSVKVAQVGKIITGAFAVGGAIVLGEVFEKYLLTVPGMQFPIPLLGTLANVIGLFLGSLVSGLIGAITLNLIDKFIANRLKAEATKEIIVKQNEIANIQQKQISVAEMKVENTKAKVSNEIKGRHEAVKNYMDSAADIIYGNMNSETSEDDIIITKNDNDFQQMQKELENLI